MLTSEREHRYAGHVGMHDVPRQQCAQRLRVLARAAASPFVRQKTDAVDVREEPRHRGVCANRKGRIELLPGAVAACHLAHRQPVLFGRAVAQLAVERLLQRAHVPVLAEHKRQHEPQVACADPSVGTMISVERASREARHVGRAPGAPHRRGHVHRCRIVPHVVSAERCAARNGARGPPNEYAVHDDRVARREVEQCDLVLRLHRHDERETLVPVHDRSACSEVGKRDEHVVVGVDAEQGLRHHALDFGGRPGWARSNSIAPARAMGGAPNRLRERKGT